MKNSLKNCNGITLVALVTAIVVILILASVAIYSGRDALERSHLTAFTTELKIMQTHVNEIYQQYIDGDTIQLGNDTYTGENILTMRKNSSDSEYSTNIEDSSLPIYNVAQNVFTSGQSGITDKSGYLYFNKKLLEDLDIKDINGEYFVNIAKRSVVSCVGFEYYDEVYYTLEQLPDSIYNVEYDSSSVNSPIIQNSSIEKISEEKWRITISNIQYNGYVDKWKVKYRLETEENWNTSEDLSFIVTKNGKYKVKVVNGNIESAEIEVGPYVIPNISSSANAPKLSDGMIPIKWDTSKREGKGNWVICTTDDEDWYSYTATDKKWANVMLCDGKYTTVTPRAGQETVNLSNPVTLGGEEIEVAEEDLGSMFVWIPRYAYKITSGYHDVSESGAIDIVWLNGTSYYYVDDEENVQIALNGNAKDGNGNQVTSENYYIAHPAFTDGSVNQYKYQKENYANGEWKEEITGLWFSKFQAGFATTDKDISQRCTYVKNLYYPIFKGRKYAYNYVAVDRCYRLSQALDDNNNPYGLSEMSNSHLVKSSEWGAVTYLSISKFGYSGGVAELATQKAHNNLSLVESYSDTSSSEVLNPNNSSNKITAITGYSALTGKDEVNVLTGEQVTKLADYTKFDEIDNINNKSYSWNTVTSNRDYGDGTKASTSGNIYGIYDMTGCLQDYVSFFIKNGNINSNNNAITTNKSTYLVTSYPNSDTNSGRYDFNNNYISFNKIFGDAIWETSQAVQTDGNGNILAIKGWFDSTLECDNGADDSCLNRGGHWNTTNGSLMSINDSNGFGYDVFGFHSVLIVE